MREPDAAPVQARDLVTGRVAARAASGVAVGGEEPRERGRLEHEVAGFRIARGDVVEQKRRHRRRPPVRDHERARVRIDRERHAAREQRDERGAAQPGRELGRHAHRPHRPVEAATAADERGDRRAERGHFGGLRVGTQARGDGHAELREPSGAGGSRALSPIGRLERAVGEQAADERARGRAGHRVRVYPRATPCRAAGARFRSRATLAE